MEDSRFNIDESAPEVKSFIYQQIQDFAFFMTANSVINVVSEKVPKKKPSSSTKNREGRELFKVTITISENKTSIEEVALSSNIYEAIKLAKSKLYERLLQIQDEVISSEDRMAQITSVKGSLVH